MRRLAALCAVLALAACTTADRLQGPGAVAEPVMEAAPMATDCAPGEGDGIGGTGCQVN